MGVKRRSRPLLAALIVLAYLSAIGGAFWMASRLKAQSPSSIARVNSADKDLQGAIKVARSHLPQFIDRLKHPTPGDRFAIKSKFKTPLEPEYLWVRDPVAKGSDFSGIVDEVPIAVPDLHKGDRVTIKQADVVDWLVMTADHKMAGGFTDLALGSGPH